MAGSRSVVIAALIANGAIAIMKFFGFLLTGSPAMLSETYHSISDTGNQVFLLVGIRFSKREADQQHPFGYGKAEFFYSFLVSVLLFGIAGWESAKHGYDKLVHGGHAGPTGPPTVPFTDVVLGFDPIYVNYTVLVGAIVFEGWALYKANGELQRQIDAKDWSGIPEAFRKTSDVTTLTAFTEDTIALVGAALALVGIFLTETLHDPVYDAAAAFLIGLLLMGFAVALAWENKRLLMGESLPAEEEARLREVARNWEGVSEIADLRTVYFGPGKAVLTADLVFDEGMETGEIDDAITELEGALKDADEEVSTIYIEPES